MSQQPLLDTLRILVVPAAAHIYIYPNGECFTLLGEVEFAEDAAKDMTGVNELWIADVTFRTCVASGFKPVGWRASMVITGGAADPKHWVRYDTVGVGIASRQPVLDALQDVGFPAEASLFVYRDGRRFMLIGEFDVDPSLAGDMTGVNEMWAADVTFRTCVASGFKPSGWRVDEVITGDTANPKYWERSVIP